MCAGGPVIPSTSCPTWLNLAVSWNPFHQWLMPFPVKVLSQQVSQISLSTLLGNPDHTCRAGLPDAVITDSYMLLFQWWLWYSSIVDDQLIILKHIGWSIQRYPKHYQLVPKASINLVAILRTIISESNVEVSTVFCCLEYHSICALFAKMIMPVWDLLETTSPAWSASTKQSICTAWPRGSGMLEGALP